MIRLNQTSTYNGYLLFQMDRAYQLLGHRCDQIQLLLFERLLATEADAPLIVQGWVKKQLGIFGLPDHGSIAIKMHERLPWAAYDIPTHRIVTLNADDAKVLENDLAGDDEGSKKFVARCRGMLAHEAGHLYFKDRQHRFIAQPLFAPATNFGFDFVIDSAGKYLMPSTTILGAVLYSGIYLASIYPKIATTVSLDKHYHRQHEKRADQFAFNHAESRQEIIETIYDYDELHFNFMDHIAHPELPNSLINTNKSFGNRYKIIHAVYSVASFGKTFSE